jgi:hypothetical protein
LADRNKRSQLARVPAGGWPVRNLANLRSDGADFTAQAAAEQVTTANRSKRAIIAELKAQIGGCRTAFSCHVRNVRVRAIADNREMSDPSFVPQTDS